MNPYPVKVFLPLLLLAGLFGLLGCSGHGIAVKNLAKTDIDMVADAHVRTVEQLLRELTIKLYRRNPNQLKKKTGITIETRLRQIFGGEWMRTFDELDGRQGIPAMLLSFEPEYRGDRVFALMVGLTGMLRSSYNGQQEFYLLDSLDQQKLYDSARNIEILVWRLKNRCNAAGRPLLLTNGRAGEVENLSFERLFGKLIAHQDMMARITSEKWGRTINHMVQNIASAAFLPIGMP